MDRNGAGQERLWRSMIGGARIDSIWNDKLRANRQEIRVVEHATVGLENLPAAARVVKVSPGQPRQRVAVDNDVRSWTIDVIWH
jgi:hypothetical protein